MIRIDNVVIPSPEQWKAIIMGMRNPLNSWNRSDSQFWPDHMQLGDKDRDLMKRLADGGTVHAKYRRMITVYADITAPLYWWKEFDTYKVGTAANSCSTMHKIAAKEFTLEDFSYEHLLHEANCVDKDILDYRGIKETPLGVLYLMISSLNLYRECYIETRDKKYWWQMIQLLPSSYNQKRTVMMNYEVLAGIYPMRKDHKLDEWHDFCDWIKSLPYSELITGGNKNVR